TVTNTNDSGPGSLRQTIANANATAGTHTIALQIPRPTVHTTTPTSPLPAITGAVTIDGYTQPGASPNTQLTRDDAVLLVEINGASTRSDSVGLAVSGSGAVTIRGLIVNRFGSANVSLAGGRLEGCFIGTDPTGALARSRGTA